MISGFRGGWLLRGFGPAPAAVGITLWRGRAGHDRTAGRLQAAIHAETAGDRVKDMAGISFVLTSLTGALPTGPFAARLLLHRDPRAGLAAPRAVVRAHRAGSVPPALFTARLLGDGRLHLTGLLGVSVPPGPGGTPGPFADWWGFEAMGLADARGRCQRLCDDGF